MHSQFQERAVFDCLTFLMHLATIAAIREGLQEIYKDNEEIFVEFKNSKKHNKILSLLSLSIICRVAESSDENEIKADDSMLELLKELVDNCISSKDKIIKRNDIEFSLENLLFTLELLSYNAENSTYLLKKRIGPSIFKALKHSVQIRNDGEIKCCLSILVIFLDLINDKEEGEVVLRCPGLTDFLQNLKSQGQNYDIAELIDEILESIKSFCDYVYECREYFNTLNIPGKNILIFTIQLINTFS